MRTPICLFVTAAVLIALGLEGGCAFMNRDNTPLLNMVENRLWPEDTVMQVVLFPILFPTGVVAVVLDAVAVHPASVIDEAARDTGDCLWEEFDWDDAYLTECATLPWRVLFTPPIFLGDFLARALFNVPTEADRLRREQEEVEARRQVLSHVDSMEKDAVLETLEKRRLDTESLDRLLRSDDPILRWIAVRLVQRSDENHEILLAGLRDSDPLVRYAALALVDKMRLADEKGFRDPVKEMADHDPNAILRTYARRLLR